MGENVPKNDDVTVWDGFGATLIHDIGKIAELTTVFSPMQARFSAKGRTLSHTDLREIIPECFKHLRIGGSPQIPDPWYGLIKKEFRSPPAGRAAAVQAALSLADRISKQIQGELYSRLENSEWLRQHSDVRQALSRDALPTHFYSYWKDPKLWDASEADRAFEQICRTLAGNPTPEALVVLQNVMNDFPHTRYVPHLSLRLHDLLAASLFYFIYRALREVGEWKKLTEFAFYAFEVSPDLLDVFYRLRDVLACSRQASEFYRHLFAELFAPWERDLPGITAEHNPFVFYESQGLVFLYPDFGTARAGLETALNAVPALRRIETSCNRFAVDLKYVGPHWDLGPVTSESFVESLPAKSLEDFAPRAGARCEACGRVALPGELTEDDKGNLLCESCRASRRGGSGIDLDAVSMAGKMSDRIAYVFVTLPPDLRTHAAEIAGKRLIPDFWSDHHLPPNYQLPATEQHVYEYLQALLALQQFDAALWEGVQVIRLESGPNAAHILFENPSSKAIVVHEDYFWELLEFIHHQKQKLKLECSVRAVISPPKAPFWSLVELATKHQARDTLWDISKGAIHMFSDAEIISIRQLAREAQRYRIWRNQLNALSSIALQTSLEELILEIDNRTDRLKELRDPLKKALRALMSEGSPLKDQEKRAVFFKYVAGLTR